jgi:tetratricopeptide (TPR) repeat protein
MSDIKTLIDNLEQAFLAYENCPITESWKALKKARKAIRNYHNAPTPENLAEALCDAMPNPGGGSDLIYEDALEAAEKALAALNEPRDAPYDDGVF